MTYMSSTDEDNSFEDEYDEEFKCVYQVSKNKTTSKIICDCILCSLDIQLSSKVTWRETLNLSFQVLIMKHNKRFFHWKQELLPFVKSHWDRVINKPRYQNWEPTLRMVLSKYKNIWFIQRNDYWAPLQMKFRVNKMDFDVTNYIQPDQEEDNFSKIYLLSMVCSQEYLDLSPCSVSQSTIS